MENPVSDIPHVIHLLTQSKPSLQRSTIERYFTPNASFQHPLCRIGSFEGSRWLLWCIYRWYKIMSPRIEMGIDSVAYDAKTLQLYVQMHQVFKIWLIPGYFAPVSLVTVLQLVRRNGLYYIQSQHDLYQVNELVKFFSLFRVVWLGIFIWQFIATAFCVLGALVFSPISWVEENVVGGNQERTLKDIVDG